MNKEILEIIENSRESHNKKMTLFLDRYISDFYSLPVRDNVILYESFSGAGMIDNPYGIFLDLVSNQFLEHIWVLKDFDENSYNILKYINYNNVKFIKYNSDEYMYYLSTAKILINNCTFPSWWTKKENQIYINTWHGLSIKALGYRKPNGIIETDNVIRNFLAADYINCYCEKMRDIYTHDYKLNNIKNEKTFSTITGTPRVRQMITTGRQEVIDKLKSVGVEIDESKKIILYAPTWRGTLKEPKELDISSIVSALTIPGYQVLVKSHHVNYEKTNKFIPSSIDANELLSICDVLVTDYSSIYFDWLFFNKPVIIYAPDLGEYEKVFGHTIMPPIHRVSTIKELKIIVNNLYSYWEQTKSIVYQERITYSDYFTLPKIRNFQPNYQEKDVGAKQSVLIYPGDLKPNGVTTSLIGLTNSISYQNYDVSILVLNKKDELYLRTLKNLNPKARIIVRAGTYSQTLLEHCANDICLKKGIGSAALKEKLPKELYKREWRRCFGDTKFDILINFTGYSPFYSYFFINAPFNCKKMIWLHNEMVRDSERDYNGKKLLKAPLNAVFSTYEYYDNLINVSSYVKKINEKDFPQFRDKMITVRNYIEPYDIIKKSQEVNPLPFDKSKENYVNVARLSEAKNQLNLINAFKRFHEDNQKAELWIVGDGELKEQLLQAADNKEYIHIVGFYENSYPIIRDCDYFIFPSKYEGQGLAVLEAAILKKKIIATKFTPPINGVSDSTLVQINGTDEDSIYFALVSSHLYTTPIDFDIDAYNKRSKEELKYALQCINLRDF